MLQNVRYAALEKQPWCLLGTCHCIVTVVYIGSLELLTCASWCVAFSCSSFLTAWMRTPFLLPVWISTTLSLFGKEEEPFLAVWQSHSLSFMQWWLHSLVTAYVVCMQKCILCIMMNKSSLIMEANTDWLESEAARG